MLGRCWPLKYLLSVPLLMPDTSARRVRVRRPVTSSCCSSHSALVWVGMKLIYLAKQRFATELRIDNHLSREVSGLLERKIFDVNWQGVPSASPVSARQIVFKRDVLFSVDAYKAHVAPVLRGIVDQIAAV